MTPGPSLTVLLDDYDIIHNQYLENRVTMNLDNYDETNNSRYVTKVIDFLGCNKTQIKKNVITANMDTNWKNILERVLKMYDKEIGKLSPPRNHNEKCKQFASAPSAHSLLCMKTSPHTKTSSFTSKPTKIQMKNIPSKTTCLHFEHL